MNKMLRNLLVAALVISASNVSANTNHTNKTHMTTRNQALINLPLEVTTTNEVVNTKHEANLGGTVMATGFYGQNTKNAELGKYFGFADKNIVTLGTDIAKTDIIDGGTASTATVKFAPEVVDYGVTIGWYQDLSKICDGLNFKVIVPVQHKEQDMKLATSDTEIVNYFAGKNVGNAAVLKYGKIDGKQSETGVANIEAKLGYKFLDKSAYNAGVNVIVDIPTGSEVKAAYAFAPQVGSKNWGLGAGLDAQARVWGDVDHNVKLNFATNYRYMFQATEQRILGLKGVNFAQYRLAANVPVANNVTTDVNVTPGSNLDAILGLGYNNGGFIVDLGYNLYFAEQESVKIKGAAIAAQTVNAVAQAVDYSAAETPKQFTNSIYAGVGYSFKECEYPVTLGLGGKYEFAAKNSALEGWQTVAKVGLTF